MPSRKVDVVYTFAKVEEVRKLIAVHKHIRIHEITGTTAIWIDKDSKWGDDNKLGTMVSIIESLKSSGLEPWLITHIVPERNGLVIPIDQPPFGIGSSASPILQMDKKHHFEALRYKKGEVFVRYDPNVMSGGRVIWITNIWLMGSHTHVRKVRRYIGHQLTNGNKAITQYDLDRIRQIGGYHVQIYMQLNDERIIDVSNQSFAKEVHRPESNLHALLNNSRHIYLADPVKVTRSSTIWNSIFNSI